MMIPNQLSARSLPCFTTFILTRIPFSGCSLPCKGMFFQTICIIKKIFRNEALLHLTNIYFIKSRLINDEATCYGTEIIHIFKKWSSAIETKDDQIELAVWMKRMRTAALNEYDSFYDSVLHGLKDISEMQAEALSYWLKNGNLVHQCEKLTNYPNVSLRCEYTELDFGNIFVIV